MARLTLNPNATFELKVAVSVPGGSADIGLTFKYRDRDEAKSWIDSHGNTTDAEVILDCVTAWDLDDEFSLENVRRLCKMYPAAPGDISGAYVRELLGIRRGN